MTAEARSDEELRALCDAATPGPWSAADEHGLMPGAAPAWCVSRMDGEKWLYDVFYHASQSDGDQAQRDGEFVAAARTAIPSLLARIAAVEAAPAIGELAAQQSTMISGSYPADLSDEAHMWRRCAKAGEEHGEVVEALLGFVGENPRKGVTADREKVIKELLDEAFAALGAVEYLRGNDGSSGRLLAEHAQFVTGRLRAALAASPTPTGPEPAPTDHHWDFRQPATTCRRCGSEYDSARWVNCPGPGPATPEPTEETP